MWISYLRSGVLWKTKTCYGFQKTTQYEIKSSFPKCFICVQVKSALVRGCTNYSGILGSLRAALPADPLHFSATSRRDQTNFLRIRSLWQTSSMWTLHQMRNAIFPRQLGPTMSKIGYFYFISFTMDLILIQYSDPHYPSFSFLFIFGQKVCTLTANLPVF